MRKRILGFVFAAALLAAMAVPLFGGGTALATGGVRPPDNPTHGNAPVCVIAGNATAHDGFAHATTAGAAISSTHC